MRPRFGWQVRITALLCALVVAAHWGGQPVPALAQNPPTLKEILGRAQSEAEKKAVEDLIGKLQGRPLKPDAPVQANPQPQGTAAPTPQPSEQADAKPVATTRPSEEKPDATGQTKEASATEKAEQPPPDKAAAVSVPEKEKDADTSTDDEPKAASSAALITPEAAIKSAAQQELPSVDLEVYFEFDSAEITPQAHELLVTLGRALSDERLASDTFLIAGHTDAKGRQSYNRRLSSMRARAVRDFLVANFAIDPNRIQTKGFGSRHLKNREDPRAAENRRVQIVNVAKREAR